MIRILGGIWALRKILLDSHTRNACASDVNSIFILRKTVNQNYFLSATLAQTFNNRSSALTGAAITVLALAEPFIAAGAAVGFWYFFPIEKGLGPRGYERNEIMNGIS